MAVPPFQISRSVASRSHLDACHCHPPYPSLSRPGWSAFRIVSIVHASADITVATAMPELSPWLSNWFPFAPILSENPSGEKHEFFLHDNLVRPPGLTSLTLSLTAFYPVYLCLVTRAQRILGHTHQASASVFIRLSYLSRMFFWYRHGSRLYSNITLSVRPFLVTLFKISPSFRTILLFHWFFWKCYIMSPGLITSSCSSSPSAGITGVPHHALLPRWFMYWFVSFITCYIACKVMGLILYLIHDTWLIVSSPISNTFYMLLSRLFPLHLISVICTSFIFSYSSLISEVL